MTNSPNLPLLSGFSANDIFCLDKLGMSPGELCVGNSVMALGVVKGVGAGLNTLAGGEVVGITKLVSEARRQALMRLLAEADKHAGAGVGGIAFDIVNHTTNVEFIATGSVIHSEQPQAHKFSAACDNQALLCHIDAGFQPRQFVFGNVAASIGVGGNILGSLRSLRRGEVHAFSAIFKQTRHLALKRITREALRHGANAVVDIRTTIAPFMGTQELMMVGTAAVHPLLSNFSQAPITSDMTALETWNMANMGYLPLQLVMGVSVYSLGMVRGLGSAFASLIGGEVSGLTDMLYDARAQAIEQIRTEAKACNADLVVGLKVKVYDLGFGLVEVMALGTAVKKVANASTASAQLPPQTIIVDEDTLKYNGSEAGLGQRGQQASGRQMQIGPLRFILILIGAFIYGWLKWKEMTSH